MPWHFFAVACMLSAPTDCVRVVLDTPREVASIEVSGKPEPPSFASGEVCLRALAPDLHRYIPFKVAGSEWVSAGCTKQSEPLTQNEELEHTCFNKSGSAVVECPRVTTAAQAKDKPWPKPWPCSQCTNGWIDAATGMCPYRPRCKTNDHKM